ncbi:MULTISPECIES: NVEALA domain-containing protein [Bacteroides]|jgi:hypothetical protein|uniref:NVEALA protein n=1 Tax=Bacteroides intestinalis TaxID=329854 RepID=A0AAQ0LNK0_9BACE|nr:MULTISPECIES: NVEALA domain-containing protein [Bacteroides]QDO67724.1 hypothetical protein DXK01_001730 [Bacteroides intestinalis]RGT50581.1 hypothetical protein DWX27_13490 [Bacteroides intestinalis]RGX84033.1 hypothetical protein DXA61_15715 [Bacteroides intestinalis]RHI00799.1 hypothetical protein DW182_20915 [Bacteroides sp. AM16-24]UCB35955.1 NVEALA domain-containing protein [Bacteroides intestinalis]
MKNKIKIAVISLCAVSSISVFCSQKSSGKQMDDLLLKNVEALAWGEGGYSHCLGLGDVDCPFSKTKVEYVMSGYSLEDLY